MVRLGKEGNVEGRGQDGHLLGGNTGKWEQSLAMLCLELQAPSWVHLVL